MDRGLRLVACLVAFGCVWLRAQEVPKGTILEARFSRATSSSKSHRGDPIEATVIAPVALDGRTLIPFRSTISGVVSDVHRLGFGLKQTTASIEYRFDSLTLPGRERIPVKLRLLQVETAKEQVGTDGVVRGIHPIVGLSSGLSFCTVLLSSLSPVVSLPVWGIKFLIAPSANPEISFSAGTEVLLRFTEAAQIPGSYDKGIRIAKLRPEEAIEVKHLLRNTAEHRAYLGKRPSDWVNLVFSGTAVQLAHAFESAGWTEAHRRSPVSLYRMYLALTKRKGYPKAPMNVLTLNGALPTLVYQKSLDTVEKRHHVRLWAHPEFPNLWLAAASEDVGFQFRSAHWTHLTSPIIDAERAKVVNDLAFTGCVETVGLLPRTSSVERAGFGEHLMTETDERIAAVQLTPCIRPHVMPGVQSSSSGIHHRRIYQIFGSVKGDLLRSNIFFMVYNTARALTTKSPRQSPESVTVRQNLAWLPSSDAIRGDVAPQRKGEARSTSAPVNSSPRTQEPGTQSPTSGALVGNTRD